MEKETITFINDSGCSMSFEDLNDSEIKERLAFLGSNWRLKPDKK